MTKELIEKLEYEKLNDSSMALSRDREVHNYALDKAIEIVRRHFAEASPSACPRCGRTPFGWVGDKFHGCVHAEDLDKFIQDGVAPPTKDQI